MLRLVYTGLLVALLVLLGTVGSPAYSQPAQTSGDLHQALALLPAAADRVSFTDWALLKRYEGVPNLTSKSPAAARLHFMQSLTTDQAAASAFDAAFFPVQAATWGWDATDLVWEASTTLGPSLPIYVLRFRDAFAFAPVLAHFVQYGFRTSTYHGVTVYSHLLDANSPWSASTDLALLNTAVLPAQKLFVLSAALSGVQAVLDAYRKAVPALGDAGAVQDTAAQMGAPAAAVLDPNPCRQLSFTALLATTTSTRRQIEVLEHQTPPLHPYTVLGLGYRDEGTQPLGLLLLHYPAAGAAGADLARRRTLAASGTSAVSGTPYATSVFRLLDASVHGSDLQLRLRPVHDAPSRLFAMLSANDMLFAACP